MDSPIINKNHSFDVSHMDLSCTKELHQPADAGHPFMDWKEIWVFRIIQSVHFLPKKKKKAVSMEDWTTHLSMVQKHLCV